MMMCIEPDDRLRDRDRGIPLSQPIVEGQWS